MGEVGPYVGNTGWVGYFEFPQGSELQYLHAARLMIGSVQGVDTLVSGRPPGASEFLSYDPLTTGSYRLRDSDYDPQAKAAHRQ